MRRAARTPLLGLLAPVVWCASRGCNAGVNAEAGRISTRIDEPAMDLVKRRWPATLQRSLRKVAIGKLGGALDRPLRISANPDWNRPLHWQRVQPHSGDAVVLALEGDHPFRPQQPHHLDLLFEAPPSIVEVHAERLVFDRVPADADTHAEFAAGQHIHLGGLLGSQHGLALRQDDDARHQLESRRHGGQVAEQHHWLVEHAVDGVRTRPARATRGIRADHMVVRQQVLVPQLLDCLRERFDAGWIGANLGLWKYGADLHRAPQSGMGTSAATALDDSTCESAFCCATNSSALPVLARSSSRSSCARGNAAPSAVPWTSTR